MRFGLVVLGVFLLDRVTKWWVIQNFDLYASRPLWDGVIWLTYVQNKGAAFGIMPGKSWFFLIVAIVLIAGLSMYTIHYPVTAAVKLPLSLLVGGALGNFLDRLLYGHVIDFIDLKWWPVFNIADMAIVIGGIILAFNLTPRDRKEVGPV